MLDKAWEANNPPGEINQFGRGWKARVSAGVSPCPRSPEEGFSLGPGVPERGPQGRAEEPAVSQVEVGGGAGGEAEVEGRGGERP